MMNRYQVAANGLGPSKTVSFVLHGQRHVLSTEQALELASWIVALTDPNEERFDEILRQIEDG